ncbi:MAG: hypothetical protein ACXWCK_31410 [Burkholderiales bacterium]
MRRFASSADIAGFSGFVISSRRAARNASVTSIGNNTLLVVVVIAIAVLILARLPFFFNDATDHPARCWTDILFGLSSEPFEQCSLLLRRLGPGEHYFLLACHSDPLVLS